MNKIFFTAMMMLAAMSFVMSAVNKVKHRYELMHTATISSVDQDDAIFLKTEYKVVRILISQILYVEGRSEYLRIHLATATAKLSTDMWQISS